MRFYNRKMIILFIFLFFLIVCIGYYFNLNFSKNNTYLSLKEAYELAFNQIIEEDVYLYTMTSADLEDVFDLKDGENGKRRFWNLDFNKLNTTDHYIFQIQDGEIVNQVQVPGLNVGEEKLIDSSEILIDSCEALKISKENYEINPGIEWALGYHFMLNKYNGTITISVTGFDQENNFRKIHINPVDLKHELE